MYVYTPINLIKRVMPYTRTREVPDTQSIYK